MKATITGLFTYPVKSCGALSHRQVTVNPSGFLHDRAWMVVDAAGAFLSQRKHPAMTLIQPSFHEGDLVLDAPSFEPLRVPLAQVGELTQVVVWEQACVGMDQGAEANEWLSDYLGISVRLVKQSQSHPRLIKDRYQRDEISLHTSFADGFASLLVSDASLRSLNEQLESSIGIDRFRPNIVVDGPGLVAYEEDHWRKVRLGNSFTYVLKPCARCPIPDIDQQTGARGTAVRTALGRSRKGVDQTKPGAKPGVFFGQNVGHVGPFPFNLHVGDAVEAVETAESNVLITAGH